MKNKKLMLFLGIVVIVIIGYYLTMSRAKNDSIVIIPTPSTVDTKNWLTYKNEVYGYALEYPENVKMDIGADSRLVTFQLADALGIKYKLPTADAPDGKDRFYFRIVVMNDPENLTLDQWIKQEKSGRQAPQPNIQNKTTLDGEEAYYLEYIAGLPFDVGSYSYIAIYVIHNNIKYRISGLKIPADSKSKSYLETNDVNYGIAVAYEKNFNKMLSSFKFTP